MILNAQQITEAVKANEISIIPFLEDQVQAATYDLKVGDQGATTSTKKIINIKDNGYIIIQPGDFAVITVLEEIRLGNQYAGRIGLRSKYARKGLIATTGPQIDPGFHGRLIIGVTNLTPKHITLPYRDDFISIELHRLDSPTTKPYTGPYQDKVEFGPEEIEAITEAEGMALSEVMRTLQSLSTNVGNLATQFNAMKWIIPAIVTIGIAIIAVLVAIK